jgi:hypothetical protein
MAQSRSLSNTVDHVTGHWIRRVLPTLAVLGCGNAKPPRYGSTYRIEPPPGMHQIEVTPPRGTIPAPIYCNFDGKPTKSATASDAANSHAECDPLGARCSRIGCGRVGAMKPGLRQPPEGCRLVF